MRYAIVRSLATHWPFANGSGRFIDMFASERQFAGAGFCSAVTSHGDVMDVIADDLIGKHIILSGRFDRTPIDMLIKHGRKGDHILDIGANIGYMSCCMLAAIPGSIVTCVEPQPLITDLLASNMERNHPGRYTIVRAALSDYSGTIQMAVDEVNRGASHVVLGNKNMPTTSIPAVKTSEFLSGLTQVDLLKIDVEGHEEPIFRDGADQLDRLRPRAILLEDRLQRMSPSGDIGRILVDLGYKIFGIKKKLLQTELVSIQRSQDEVYNDYIAVRQSLLK